MAVKTPIGNLGLSNGARACLTSFVAGLARQPELASNNVTISCLLPGAFETERLLSPAHGDGPGPGDAAAAPRDPRRPLRHTTRVRHLLTLAACPQEKP